MGLKSTAGPPWTAPEEELLLSTTLKQQNQMLHHTAEIRSINAVKEKTTQTEHIESSALPQWDKKVR